MQSLTRHSRRLEIPFSTSELGAFASPLSIGCWRSRLDPSWREPDASALYVLLAVLRTCHKPTANGSIVDPDIRRKSGEHVRWLLKRVRPTYAFKF
ncbi:hypothetical protein PHBOTO_002151 [Pseudozyma hubeiensis]|nr:hypothetical protein PHBOTO_002151 [Pseudozyma hubeiensis]